MKLEVVRGNGWFDKLTTNGGGAAGGGEHCGRGAYQGRRGSLEPRSLFPPVRPEPVEGWSSMSTRFCVSLSAAHESLGKLAG